MIDQITKTKLAALLQCLGRDIFRVGCVVLRLSVLKMTVLIGGITVTLEPPHPTCYRVEIGFIIGGKGFPLGAGEGG